MHCAAQKVKRSFMDRLKQTRDRRLPAMQKLCLLVLSIRADEDEQCWPSLDTIAAEMGCHKTTAIRALNQLEDAKLITVERSLREDGRPAANVYKLANGDSSGALPIQSRSATVIVAERYGDSSGALLEVTTEDTIEVKKDTRERERTVAPATNVVDFSTWATPEPLETDATAQVVFKDDGSLHANDAFRRFWLPDFDDDHHQLDLAIIQATPYIQPNTSKPLEALLSSQLARQVRDRKSQDQRYYAARNKSDEPQPGGLAALLDQREADARKAVQA